MSDWTINQYIKALWRSAWLVLLVTFVAAGASVAVSQQMTPIYRATASVMTGEDNTNPQVKMEDYVLSQRLATGYAGLAKRQVILEEVVKSLGLQMDWHTLQDNVLVAPITNTSLLEIRVTDSNPRRSAAIANEIARQLVLHSATLSNEEDLRQRQTFTQSQLDALQSNIDSAQVSISQKQAALDTETSARAVTDLQDQIKALQAKVTDWRAEYQRLLGGMPTRSASTITIVETAAPPTEPVSPNVLFNVLLAALAGLVLSGGSVFLIEYLKSSRVRNLAELGGAPGLGMITRMKRPTPRGAQPSLIALGEPHSLGAEQFRVIRSNVRFAWAGPEPIVLLVTSPGIGEGKSTISGNLAASFAQTGKQTILVDADMRHPSIHNLLGINNGPGLSSLLSSEAEGPGSEHAADAATHRFRERVAGVLLDTAIANLAVLPAGPVVSTNPGELLASPIMAQLLELLRQSADVIVIDSPPILPVADAAILAGLPVAVLLVAEADRTSTSSIALAFEALERAQARVLGFILNKAANAPSPYYTYSERETSKTKSRRPSLRLIRRA